MEYQNSENRIITVLALGGGGCRVMRHVAANPLASRLNLLAVDTDRNALTSCGLPESRQLLAGEKWRGGNGCGGSVIDGQRAIAHERSVLSSRLEGSELLVVLCGLGGGTASGGGQVILSIARNLSIPTLFVATMPFALEGHSRRRIAEESLKNELLTVADAVITLPNDLLFSVLPPTTVLAEAFAMADREVSRTVIALSAVLACGNLLPADFGKFVSLLRRRKSSCSIGVGFSQAVLPSDRIRETMQEMLSSPLLGGGDKLGKADAVILSLLGGEDLSLGETKELLELAESRLSPESELVVGASSLAGSEKFLQLCAVTISFDDEPLAGERERRQNKKIREPKSSPRSSASEDGLEQGLLPLEDVACGIMERTAPVIWKGEKLDIPTFRRKGAVIDNGKGNLL